MNCLKKIRKIFFLEFRAGLTLIFDNFDKKITELKKFDLVFCGEKALADILKNLGIKSIFIKKFLYPIILKNLSIKIIKKKTLI